ncbi:hypothetical protein PF010_g33133 [Phytophthora fragariae]|uniref:Secreted protein n=1 Tax=Phytophthora fragariae TaxID=53985 RepID=A0A6G0JD60_9STRA|nr:hypothetical protein PF010_g33133 [Phytophthora fragariae]
MSGRCCSVLRSASILSASCLRVSLCAYDCSSLGTSAWSSKSVLTRLMKYSAGFMYCGQSCPAAAKCGIILARGPQ